MHLEDFGRRFPARENLLTWEAERKKAHTKQEQAVLEVLGHYGHAQNHGLTMQLRNDLAVDRLNTEELILMCENIAEARESRRPLIKQEIHSAPYYGLTDYTNLHWARQDISKYEFAGLDLSGSDFTDAEVYKTVFTRSLLHAIIMPRVFIKGIPVDLEEGALQLEDDSLWSIDQKGARTFVVCDKADQFNEEILTGKESPLSRRRRGALLFQEGKPLGYIKLKGEFSFIPLRTTRDAKGRKLFYQGLFTALDKPFVNWVTEKTEPYRDLTAWRRIDMENVPKELLPIGRNHIRFVDSAETGELLTELAERIEAGEEPIVNILNT